jgi:hypothetical protein
MVVLRRSTMPWISKKFRADYLITGQRIVKKSDLLEVLKEEPKAYQIEFAMNHYMMKNKKNVRWSFFYAIHTYKMQKNFLFGTINEVKMYAIIFFYNFGFIKYNLLKQLFFFRPKKLV